VVRRKVNCRRNFHKFMKSTYRDDLKKNIKIAVIEIVTLLSRGFLGFKKMLLFLFGFPVKEALLRE